ncbi:TonB family protein [Orbus wheelerorum]|uniref:TonB family protein n=1 Tax=Orbus wheelerorum TaxID=3074111 RepID=UPI00370D57D4
MIAKLNKSKKNNLNPYLSVSILVHLTIAGVLLSGAYFSDRTILLDGNDSIKAVMIDLSVMAAPKQSLVENTPQLEKVDNNEIIKDQTVEIKPEDFKKEPEIEPDLIVEKKELEKLPTTLEPKLVVKEKSAKSKDKNKPRERKASKQQTRQEVMLDKLAENVVAPTISNNTQYSAKPTPISRKHPEYPRKALDLRIEGYVVAIYDVGTNGRVENIRIIEAKPNNIFNKSVIQALKQWKFQPTSAKDLSVRIVFNSNKSVDIDNA